MLSVNSVGQNNYNTTFGCKGDANKLVQQLNKKRIEISPQALDQLTLTEPLTNATQKLRAGLITEAEHREVLMRTVFGGKMTFGEIVKNIFKKH